MKGRIKLKVYVKLDSGRSFKILAPIGIVKVVLGFGVPFARRYIPEEQRQYVDSIDFKELRKGIDVLRDYKGLTLVDIKAGDGTEVKVVI